MTTNSTALATREQIQTVSVYEPQSLADARALAVEMAASRMFSAKGKEQALAIMGAGAELGLSPLAALRMIYVADFGQGPQISISADAMRAACLRRRDICEYFRTVESTDTTCTVEAKRAGDPPRRVTWTMERAKRAKLGAVKEGKDASASNWAKYPEQMLRHRADAELAREVFPDILGGMYTADELQEAAQEARDVTPPAVQPLTAAPRPAAPVIADAEIIDPVEDVLRRYEAARTDAERMAIAPDAAKLDGEGRERARAANALAKKRIATPADAPPAATPTGTQAVLAIGAGAEPAMREPGEEG